MSIIDILISWKVLRPEMRERFSKKPVIPNEAFYCEQCDDETFLVKAYAHYCEHCDEFFKTRGGATNHKRLKHK